MKIIIDIPEDFYIDCKEWVVDKCANIEQTIIANGTPLPKGHGDLIDRDVALADFDDRGFNYEGSVLKYIPTVIPRDM